MGRRQQSGVPPETEADNGNVCLGMALSQPDDCCRHIPEDLLRCGGLLMASTLNQFSAGVAKFQFRSRASKQRHG